MKRVVPVLLLITVLMGVGCYHAVIDTGKSPGSTVIDQPWAHSFIFGLVPPAVLETAAKCPEGVAKVETQHSVPNWLVGVITFGIYTPIHIKVTCAGTAVSVNGETEYLVPEADVVINEGATPEEAAEIFQSAVDLARDSDAPVYVKFAAHE